MMTVHSTILGQLLKEMGAVGRQLSEIGATEGAAGNISICIRQPLNVTDIFPNPVMVDLPVPAPDLVGANLIVTGSGRRLREIADSPTANLACIVVLDGGLHGMMFTSPDSQFKRVTSEFNSHLAIHQDQMHLRPVNLHAVVHAQPKHITFLSHIPKYQNREFLNTHLLRWQPETILNFPEGIGVLPFLLPGSQQLMTETMLSMRDHQMVVWSQHGIIARADESILHALDLVEYIETSAQYETLNLLTGEKSEGIEPKSLRAIAEVWNVRQKVF
jgi:rhamnulose-1-phosphate aldolase